MERAGPFGFYANAVEDKFDTIFTVDFHGTVIRYSLQVIGITAASGFDDDVPLIVGDVESLTGSCISAFQSLNVMTIASEGMVV